MNEKVMLYTSVTDSMSGPFYATFEDDELVLAWATQTVNNDLLFEEIEYLGDNVYFVGNGMLVLLDWYEGKDFSSYKIEAREKLGT